MKNKLNLTYIIQGPLDVISLDVIDKYLEQGKVIVSCWDNDSITGELKDTYGVYEENYELLEPYLDRITIIKNKYPQNPEEIYNSGFIYFQSKTVLAALKKVRTKFCVSHPSGHAYPDLDVIKNKAIKNPKKYYITNQGSHTDGQIKFGMNAAFVLGQTKILKKAHELIQKFCTFGALMIGEFQRDGGYDSDNEWGLQKHKDIKEFPLTGQPLLNMQDINGNRIHWIDIPETLETLCFLIAMGEAPNISKSADQVKKYYDITPMKDLKNYRWSQQSSRGGREFKDRSLREYSGTRGMNYDKNFSGASTANHIDEV